MTRDPARRRTGRRARQLTRPGRRLAVLATLGMLVALIGQAPATATAATTTAATAPVAAAGPPPGWTTVFSDDFSGPAGARPSGANWTYDTGPGSNFGTGEIETMTDSTANVHLDGNGHLDITALGSGGSWTSGRIRTPSAVAGAPAGGKLEVTASIMQPAPAGGLGYWPAF
ncbi:hypothetical protein [Kitasatospora aureofaciens]|nr:hypothetical protein [Kitasatospora aureofaciens]